MAEDKIWWTEAQIALVEQARDAVQLALRRVQDSEGRNTAVEDRIEAIEQAIIARQAAIEAVIGANVPEHEWDGTLFRLRNPDGSWGAWVDLLSPLATIRNAVLAARDTVVSVGAQVTVDAAAAATAAGQAAADRAIVTADKATVAADKATVAADKATVAADKAIVAADKATVAADKATVATDKNAAAASAAAAAASASAMDPILKSGLTPTIDLDFSASEAILSSWFTRASAGTWFDGIGRLRDAASGAIRISHRDGVCRGALIEEGRTNSIPNNTRQGAVAASPGTLPTGWAIYGATGLTRTLSLVTVNGVDCLGIRFNGTTGDALGAYIDFTSALVNGAASGQSWTLSGFLALSAGSLSPLTSVVLNITEYTSGGANVIGGNSGNLKGSIGASLLRQTFTRTFVGGGTVAKVGCGLSISCASGVAVDFTILIGLPQLEQGAFATSAIKTSGLAATRAADSLLISGAGFSDNYNQNEGVFFAEFTLDALPATGQVAVFYVHDGSVNNRIGARITSAGVLQVIVATSSVTQALLDVGNVVLGSKNRVSITFAVNNILASLNGGAAVSDTSATIPVVDRLEIGNLSAFAGYINGGIARCVAFAKALPGAKLQEMSAL